MFITQIFWIALFALSSTVNFIRRKKNKLIFPANHISDNNIRHNQFQIKLYIFHCILLYCCLYQITCFLYRSIQHHRIVFQIYTHRSTYSIEIAYACSNCAGVAFCSIECQKEACSTYHAFECKFMDMMIGSGMSILCFIAFRMITQHGSVKMAIEKGRQTIRELCTHSNERKASDYLQRTVMSAFLLRIMQKSGFFGRRTSESGNFFN